LFTSSGQLIDLQLQIPSGTDWHLGQATGINDDGLIVGAGGRGSSGGHAFLLVPTGAQPVPVPTGTATPTSTASPTATSTATPTPTATASPTSTPTPTSTPSSSTLTVTFDDLAAPNRPLNGQYPNGAIDWGSNMWLLSGPWRQFTTNSVGFNGAQLSSATLTMLNGYRLVQFEAYNGGAGSSTLTLTCAGQSMLQRTLAADTRLTIQTGWTQSCSTITVSSTNGWDTNLDSLVLASNGANPIATNTPTPTPTPVPSAQEIVTFDALSNPGRPLNGLTGAIDWGVNAWYLSGPWGQFRTNSVGFNGPGRLSASFSLSSPRRVVQIDAFNGGRTSSTVSLSCAAQPSVTSVLAVGQLQTIRTAWSGTCTTVIVGSSNGWDTNFDTIVLEN